MMVTIWIKRENEQFWLSLENKSGFVNTIIEDLMERYERMEALEDGKISKEEYLGTEEKVLPKKKTKIKR